MARDEYWNQCFEKILYRPFDVREIFYHDAVIERGRKEVMRHMMQTNCALIMPRRVETAIPWSHILVGDTIVEHVAVSLKTIDYCFPLYYYDEEKKSTRGNRRNAAYQMMMLFEPQAKYRTGTTSMLLPFLREEEDSVNRRPNLNPALGSALETKYEQVVLPEELFCYIYAILYSNNYRNKYGEFLRTDFPRIPFTKNYKLFQELAEKGSELVELHLLKSKKLEKRIAKCEGAGNMQVVKVSYDEKTSRVYISPDNYVSGVSSEVWEYHIGGYQVAEKWLKDRKGRRLSAEETTVYASVITSIAETIKIQESLDELFNKVEKSLLNVFI
ncbi:MAG: hypothetical protein HYZ34_02310 [Ignavibacteriae bacterium]|nr:hypothetical protein [Ignavibacteriota bacterium]